MANIAPTLPETHHTTQHISFIKHTQLSTAPISLSIQSHEQLSTVMLEMYTLSLDFINVKTEVYSHWYVNGEMH